MAHDSSLPCDGDGQCMICKLNPPEEEKITCKTCVTPWHLDCLSSRPQTLADAAQWECPDCTNLVSETAPPVTGAAGSEPSALVAAIRAIESDASLSDVEKARRRQQLMGGGSDDDKKEAAAGGNDVLKLLSGSFNCSFCMQLPERPVTTPCGHNFCLKCFEKWVGQGKKTCAICRTTIPAKMASNPRINSSLVIAIRMAKMTKSNAASGPPKPYYSVLNQNKPDKAYTTERAKKTGKANACSGKIFVTVPPDHFGPILAENDPERGMGVMVGETWEDRLECRQWGAHLPHVAGICGQSDYGAQSVALSGGYEDDEDHGEWFLYTGSGGRDLSGNKRTNKTQSFDQKFDKSNEALRVSCKKGYPVRVVRSHKEKRSAYAPEQGVRYDGVYRIEKCWRKPGIQGYKVCRYLFVRCDNDPAPWTSDENGDRPRPLPVIKELKDASDVTERKGSPSWDYDEEKACWLWKRPPPVSKKQTSQRDAGDGTQTRVVRRKTKMMSVSERLLKEFCCLICHKVMNLPLTTPCAHNFCKSCLQDTFVGQTFIKERNCEGRRTLRAQKNVMKCPSCTNDISEYLQNPQVNRELMSVIETLQRQIKESEENAVSEEEKLNEDEKNDVKEEAKDDKSEVEDKDGCSEAKEDIKESDEDEVIAKSSPEANKKGKATDVTENDPGEKLHEETDNDDNKITKDTDVNSGLVESEELKADEVAKRGKKGSKKKDDGKCSSPKANNKRKAADATENAPCEKLHEETDNDNNQIIKDTDVNSGLVESEELKADEVAKRGKKGSKKKKDDGKCSSPKANNKRKAADATENAPCEKLHEETDNDNNKITKDTDVNSGLVESEELKADEVAKRGKKGSKKKKDDGKCSSPKTNKKRNVADATENAPGETLHEETDNDNNQIIKDTGVNSGLVETEELKADEVAKRGKKGSKKKKDDGKRKAADVTENAHEGTDNDSNNQITKDTGVNSDLVESEDLKADEVAKRGKKGSKKKDDGKCSSPKVNKKRKAADVTENAPGEKLHKETDAKDTGVNSGLVETEDLKVDEVAKRGKKGSKKKKDDQKCSSPAGAGAGAGARTRSRKA